MSNWQNKKYDERNPLFYVRRAGFSKATSNFYTTGKPTFTQSRFVRGFNLTIGEYFELKKTVCIELVDRGFIDIAFGTLEWKFATFDWQRRIEDLPVLHRINEPPLEGYWRHVMVHEFIKSVIHWWKEHSSAGMRVVNHELINVPLASKWSLAEGFRYPEFRGTFQIQHMTFKVLVELSDTESQRLDIKAKEVYSTKKVLTPTDRGTDGITFKGFMDTIAKDQSIQNLDHNQLRLLYISPGNTVFNKVTNNEELICAISTFQKLKQDHIDLILLGPDRELPGLNKRPHTEEEEDEDPLPRDEDGYWTPRPRENAEMELPERLRKRKHKKARTQT